MKQVPYRDRIPKIQPNKAETTPQYTFAASLHLVPLLQPSLVMCMGAQNVDIVMFISCVCSKVVWV